MTTDDLDTDSLDVETFATPAQRRRFTAAMERIAAAREPDSDSPVRVYVSAAPRTAASPKWESWLAQITEELPAGVEVLHYRSVFGDDRPYEWDRFVEQLDGLVIVGKQKRAGSRVNLLGPVARLELRSLIAYKPVLLYGHNLGLIPVIDCKSQVLRPEGTPRLKLIAPKRWKKGSATLTSALAALTPAVAAPVEETHDHLTRPFPSVPS
ncbi:hypothetical protein ACFYXL_33200 [Streptomyces tsukubensis]|uniref:hypothetical protein n=1 Tax=Streptomyces tsukubensis TaxID=83656 RepID=UPI0036CFCE2B